MFNFLEIETRLNLIDRFSGIDDSETIRFVDFATKTVGYMLENEAAKVCFEGTEEDISRFGMLFDRYEQVVLANL